MDSRVYLFLSLILYAVGAVHVFVHVVTRRRPLTTLTVASTLLGFAFHTAALSQRWTEAGHFPAVGLRDGASFLRVETARGHGRQDQEYCAVRKCPHPHHGPPPFM